MSSIKELATEIAEEVGVRDQLERTRLKLDGAWRLYASARRTENEVEARRWNREFFKARRAHMALLGQLAPAVRRRIGVRRLTHRDRVYLYMSDDYVWEILGRRPEGW